MRMASRFDIATGKTPEPPKEEPAPIVSFGIDTDIGHNYQEARTSFVPFTVDPGNNPRIAFIAPDPDHMFVGSLTHWGWAGSNTELTSPTSGFPSRGAYVLCKNVGGHTRSPCCTILGRPRWRIGTVIFRFDDIYNINSPRGQVMPWIFGERIYNQLKEMNSHFPLRQHDLVVTCENRQWRTYSFRPVGDGSRFSTEVMGNHYSKEIAECMDLVREHIGRDLPIGTIMTMSRTQPRYDGPMPMIERPVERPGIRSTAQVALDALAIQDGQQATQRRPSLAGFNEFVDSIESQSPRQPGQQNSATMRNTTAAQRIIETRNRNRYDIAQDQPEEDESEEEQERPEPMDPPTQRSEDIDLHDLLSNV